MGEGVGPAAGDGCRVDRLRPGTGEPVLVVDFLAPTSEARLSAKLAELGIGGPVYRMDPVSDVSRLGYRELDELVTGYADAWADTGERGPVLVVAYCSAAMLGLRLAERLHGATGSACLLVDAGRPTPGTIRAEYQDIRAQAGVVATDDALPDLAGRDLHEHLRGRLRRDVTARLLEQGMPAAAVERFGDEYVARCMGWLGFLLATSELCERLPAEGPGSLGGDPPFPLSEVGDGPGPSFAPAMSALLEELGKSRLRG